MESWVLLKPKVQMLRLPFKDQRGLKALVAPCFIQQPSILPPDESTQDCQRIVEYVLASLPLVDVAVAALLPTEPLFGVFSSRPKYLGFPKELLSIPTLPDLVEFI